MYVYRSVSDDGFVCPMKALCKAVPFVLRAPLHHLYLVYYYIGLVSGLYFFKLSENNQFHKQKYNTFLFKLVSTYFGFDIIRPSEGRPLQEPG